MLATTAAPAASALACGCPHDGGRPGWCARRADVDDDDEAAALLAVAAFPLPAHAGQSQVPGGAASSPTQG
jgi:hypothetical protein